MVVSLNVDHCDLCFSIQASHVFKGAFERATDIASFAEKILSAVDWSAFGEEEGLSEDEGIWPRPVLLDVIFVHAFLELMTVRGGHQKSSVIQAPDGGASWGLCASEDRLALAWPIRECCQFKAMNSRGNYIVSRKKIVWKYFPLGNVCVMEDIIYAPCNLFVLWSFDFRCSK